MALVVMHRRSLVLGYSLALLFCVIASYQHYELGHVKGLLKESEVQLARGLLPKSKTLPTVSHYSNPNDGQNRNAAEDLVVETVGYTSVPGGEYLKRATDVLKYRAKKWAEALGPNEPCSLTGPRCNVGLICDGPIGYKRCLSLSAKQAQCDGVYKLCASDLVCILGVCTDMRSAGEMCDEGFPCKPGLLCLAHTCMEPGGFNKKCDERFIPCNSEHYCKQKKCIPRHRLKEKCSMPHECAEDLFCRKQETGMFCEPRSTLGGPCACSKDCLVGLCKKEICVPASSLLRLGYGMSCSFDPDSQEVCADGLVCSIVNDKPRCTTTQDPLKHCNNSSDCEYGYTCEFGACWKRLYKRDSCGTEYRSKCSCDLQLECKMQGKWKCLKK